MTIREHPDLLQVKKRTKLQGIGKSSVLSGIKRLSGTYMAGEGLKKLRSKCMDIIETTAIMRINLCF